ncbi:hypothetical protein M407DRAFT_33134 [Tulasnella calospora MUT 4182]|uniref:Uncharacterized protein n=1 Tax=Tulasnella calospora MUT 4182 TaxID=1051891 RepID=A0A0C3K737_9AGAM|nr:hypothetical protein M407DRAFT_33134 [Tulasnella calospora MUT 4182]
MSHIPGLHRQAFGTPLLSIFLLSLTFLLQVARTGSGHTSTTAFLSLLFIFPFAIVSYVVQTDSTLTSALPVLVSWCTIVFQRTLVLCSSVKNIIDGLVNLHCAAFARTWTAIPAIPKAIDFTVNLLALIFSSTCSTKSGLELLEEGLLLPDESLFPHQSQWPYGPSSFFSTNQASNLLNDVVAHANAHRTETTLGSTRISRPSRLNQLAVALVAPINRTAKPNASPFRKSSVAFPSLSRVPGNTSSLNENDSPSSLIYRSDVFAEIVALPKRSRKIAQQNLKFVNVDKLRGPVLAATAPRRANTILSPLPPRIITHEISTASFASSGSQKYTASTTSSPHSISTSTFQSTATTPCSSQIDLQSDVEPEVPGAPTATELTTADAELLKNEEAQNLGQVVTSPEDVRLRDHHAGSGARMKIPEFRTAENAAQNDYHWKWAKTVRKRPEGRRRTRRSELVPQAPVSMPTPPPPLVTCGLDDDYLDGTDGEEEDDSDEAGFSRRQMRKTMAESKQAAPGGVARLFYGASTSAVVNGLLSQKEWDTLEQFEAALSSPKKVVRSPSPASTGVEAAIAVPCCLSTPLPPPPKAAPVKAKRLPRLRKFIKKLIPSNPFENRSRAP